MEHNRLEMIQQMLETNPDDSFLQYAAALEYKKNGKSDDSIKILVSIINNDPEYLASYYQLGKLLEEKGSFDEAINYYRLGKEVAKKQGDTKTLGELSEALMILDEDEEDF